MSIEVGLRDSRGCGPLDDDFGFYRGLDDRDEISLRSEKEGASLGGHFVDRTAEQPRLARVVAATRDYGESDQGPHYIDQMVVLRLDEQNRSLVSMFRNFRAINSDFAVKKQMNHSFSCADISMGSRAGVFTISKSGGMVFGCRFCDEAVAGLIQSQSSLFKVAQAKGLGHQVDL